ncbi:Ferroporti-1 [Dipodascopsis uninucleata]
MTTENNILLKLYISHFLSTWNARAFEYGSLVFLSLTFAETLLPVSVYAFLRAFISIILSSTINRYVEKTNRLIVIRRSIIYQRIAAIVSCVLFSLLFAADLSHVNWAAQVVIAVLFFLFTCIEKLSAITHVVSIEHDWISVISGKSADDITPHLGLHIRRINLICELAGTLTIAAAASYSSKILLWFLVVLNLISAAPEYLLIRTVYGDLPALTRNASNTYESNVSGDLLEERMASSSNSIDNNFKRIKNSPLYLYFNSSFFVPSFVLCIMSSSILVFGGQFVAYLISLGVDASMVSLFRVGSILIESFVLWIAPVFLRRIGPLRSTSYFIFIAIFCQLVAAIIICQPAYQLQSVAEIMKSKDRVLPILAHKPIAILVIFVMLSKACIRAYGVCVQKVRQSEVNTDVLPAFTGIETCFRNVFHLSIYVTTMVFASPKEFQYPVLLSMSVVSVGAFLYLIRIARLSLKGTISRSPVVSRLQGYKPLDSLAFKGEEMT